MRIFLTILCLFIMNVANAVTCDGFKFHTDPNTMPSSTYYYNEYEYVIDCQVPNVQTKKNYDEVLSNLNNLLIRFGNDDYYNVFTSQKKYSNQRQAYDKTIISYIKVNILKDMSQPNNYLKSDYEWDTQDKYVVIEELSKNGKDMLLKEIVFTTMNFLHDGTFNNSKKADTYVYNLYILTKIDSSYKSVFYRYMKQITKYNDSKFISNADRASGKKGDSVMWTTKFLDDIMGY